MPRPISWLPRLHEITKAVTNSVRSHYDRRDIEKLFELQPRAAQELLKLLPSVQIGTSRLLEREVLAEFLLRVRDTEDTTGLYEKLKDEKAAVSKRRIRSLVRRDLDAVSMTALPDSMTLSRGRLEVNFETVVQLAECMLLLARVLESEGGGVRRGVRGEAVGAVVVSRPLPVHTLAGSSPWDIAARGWLPESHGT